jgi:glutathione S-transferase
MSDPVLRLYYWPSLQGRGELVRLALEDAGAPYVDVARTPGGMAELRALLDAQGPNLAPFAPPFLVDGELVLAQVANILHHIAPRLGLVESDERARTRALQLQLTVADLFSEVHDTHHPVSTTLYYEQQKAEALARTTAFLEHRLPKFLRYFERAVQPHATTALGADHVYVDLSLFQVLAGLAYAFPRAMSAITPELPGLASLAARVASRPRIRAYLASDRRLAFNEHGIFRAYPELDRLPSWAVAVNG